jgi:hypothetical protein
VCPSSESTFLSRSEIFRDRGILEVERCVYDLVIPIALTPIPTLHHVLLLLPPPPAVENIRNKYPFASLVRSVKSHIPTPQLANMPQPQSQHPILWSANNDNLASLVTFFHRRLPPGSGTCASRTHTPVCTSQKSPGGGAEKSDPVIQSHL